MKKGVSQNIDLTEVSLNHWQKFREFMGWHKPTAHHSFDGMSMHSYCIYCGREIMQDSQGGWFTFREN